MEGSSSRHQRYITTSTSGITVLRVIDNTFFDNPLPLLQKLVKAYNEEISDGSADYETLEVLYKVLCYDYQIKFRMEPKSKQEENDDFAGLSIPQILKYILKHEEGNGNEKSSLVYDIIILQIVLYSTAEQITDHFQLWSIVDKQIVNIDVYLLSIIDCITEALYLKAFVYQTNDTNNVSKTKICRLYLNQVTMCLFRVENPQWKLFISILKKMILTFDPNIIVLHVWEIIFSNNYNDFQKKLTLLSCVIDDILTLTNDEIIKSTLIYCSKEQFWQFIFNGLTSTEEQQRKQAMYIMKRVLEFIKKYRQLSSVNESITPFVYCQGDDEGDSLKQAMIKFFLILESLEEKQGHLIIPVLSHLKNLMHVNIEHQMCGNCFDRIWLRCIFQNILRHKTNTVMKLGLLHLMKMDPRAFDEAFLLLMVQSLNNTSLYDNRNMRSLPGISKELAGLFIKAEYSQVDLINEFIQAASQITWAPLPLFYIVESLKVTIEQLDHTEYNVWSESEIEAITTIIEKNLSIQSPPMREEIQINICKIFFCCANQPLDLNILMKMFSAFPSQKILNRGSDSWELITDYLYVNITCENAIEFICQACDELCINQDDSQINLKSLALMIVLLYDGKKIFTSKQCNAQKSMCNVLDSIRDADVRPYADMTLCLQTIQLIQCLLNVLLVVRENKLISYAEDYIIHLIFPYLDAVQRVILKSLKPSSSPKTYEEATIYVESFRAIIAFNRFVHLSFNFTNDMKMFQDETIRNVDDLDGNIDLRYWYNLQISYIATTCISDIDVDMKMYENFLFKMCRQQLRIGDKSNTPNGGKIISECYEIIAKSLKLFFIYNIGDSNIDFKQWLLNFNNLIDVGKEYVISSLASTLREWFDRAHKYLLIEDNTFESIIDVSWSNVWTLKKNQYFWSSVDQLIGLMLQTNFLNRKNLTPTVTKYIEHIIAQSENIPNLKNVLIQHFRELKTVDFFHFHDAFIKCFLHTNIGRIDKRVETQAYGYLMSQHDIFDIHQYTITTTKQSGVYIDVLFRAECVLLLLRMLNSERKPHCTTNAVLFYISILESLKNKRYFGDSNIHRVKHRVLQLLLIIQPLLDKMATIMVYDTMCDLIINDNDQPSVRVMQEWLLMKIFINDPSLRDNVWDLLEVAKSKRPSRITSVASIIYHVSQKLPLDKKVQYIRIAIRKLLSSCINQTFVVRLYCQVILSKLFDSIQSLWSLSLDYTLIKDAIIESLRQGNLKKNSMKLFEDFYFHIFDPIQDYDLQIIFYDLPRLLNMSADELISPNLFLEIRSEWNIDEEDIIPPFHIAIENKRDALGFSRSPDTHHLSNDITLEEAEDICDDTVCDMQKKIMPWRPTLLMNEDLSSRREQKLVNDTGLIVVASLIDSIANLGGLARTAEIFCAKELVLTNIKCVQCKEFQSLSVSAEKWIAIREIKSHELTNYLLEKKSMGWTLVGAEQTANSINLLDMKFEKKSVLLLGNEKSGIPANLIPLMDFCVEIPQAGVIRSLNVHVTGAICMWHYGKQHIF